ncbi:MAG: TetR/AcrR family transcriptional regulator [Flavobacteriales bacterium]|nr:TetR/AcrR family transcriptional regulator [Flavobacteriales bacterium]
MATATLTSDKRQAIMDATLELVSKHGFEGTSTALIAKEANVGMGTLYRYFETKEELFKEMFIHQREQLLGIILSGIVGGETTIYGQFSAIVHALGRFYMAHQVEFEFLQRYSDSSYMKESYLDDSAIILAPIANILSSGGEDFRFKALPTHIIFAMVYGPMISIIQLVHQEKVSMTDEMLDSITRSLWNSITEKKTPSEM